MMMKAGLLASLPFSTAFESFANSANNTFLDIFLKEEDLQFIAVISETLIPKTETIGAIEAGVPHFVDLYVKNCFTESRQKNYLEILRKYHDYLVGKSISLATTNDALTKQLIEDEISTTLEGRPFRDFIRQTKSMVVKGYFTNQKAVMQNLFYKAVPGEYQACIEIKTIGKAWTN
jgi:hypothetical protein